MERTEWDSRERAGVTWGLDKQRERDPRLEEGRLLNNMKERELREGSVG